MGRGRLFQGVDAGSLSQGRIQRRNKMRPQWPQGSDIVPGAVAVWVPFGPNHYRAGFLGKFLLCNVRIIIPNSQGC